LDNLAENKKGIISISRGESRGKIECFLDLRNGYCSYFVQGQTAEEDRPNSLEMKG
jgi:hypothetical protein